MLDQPMLEIILMGFSNVFAVGSMHKIDHTPNQNVISGKEGSL